MYLQQIYPTGGVPNLNVSAEKQELKILKRLRSGNTVMSAMSVTAMSVCSVCDSNVCLCVCDVCDGDDLDVCLWAIYQPFTFLITGHLCPASTTSSEMHLS